MILPRVAPIGSQERDYTDITIEHMESFAKEGFRTLVLAYRIISEEEYNVSCIIDDKSYFKGYCLVMVMV